MQQWCNCLTYSLQNLYCCPMNHKVTLSHIQCRYKCGAYYHIWPHMQAPKARHFLQVSHYLPFTILRIDFFSTKTLQIPVILIRGSLLVLVVHNVHFIRNYKRWIFTEKMKIIYSLQKIYWNSLRPDGNIESS